METLLEQIESLGCPRIVVLGDYMLDEYVYGDVERISQEAPIPVLRVNRREYRAGGAGNVVATALALGAQVACVGLRGDDLPGRQLADMLEVIGAETGGLKVSASRPTTRKTRYVGLAQHKNPHQILREDEEKTEPLADEELRELLAALQDALAAGPAVLALQDHNKGMLSGGNAAKFIELANAADAKVLVDPALVNDYSRYAGVSVLAPNRFEASLGSGVEIEDCNDAAIQQAAGTLIAATGADGVVVTLDKDGACCVSNDGGLQHIPPARLHEVADGVGAGDVVTAALSVGLAAGWSLADSAALANVAGGLEVERFGVVPVTRREVIEELRHLVGLRRSKVMDRDALAEEVTRLRDAGASVVFTNGCFDLLHLGHVRYLQQAREQGSVLIVATNTDDSIRRLKGPARPIISESERAEMLASLKCVDYVVLFDEDTPETLLELLRPDILVKGGSTDVIVGQEFVESCGGKVARLDLVEGLSTTDIINKIIETH